MQNTIGKSHTIMNHRGAVRVGKPVVQRLVQRVLDCELAVRGELKRVKRLERSGIRFKDKRHVYSVKLSGAHAELGYVLFNHIGTTVDTVKMFGDLLRDYQKDPQLVAPAVMLILDEARVFAEQA